MAWFTKKTKEKPKDIVLYGAGGFARELACMIEDINMIAGHPKYNLLGFVVGEGIEITETIINGYPILGRDEWLIEHKDSVVCTCAIGSNPTRRKEIQEYLESRGVRFETLIAPDVYIYGTTTIGAGTVICSGVMMSVSLTIGKGVVINARVTLGHDDIIGDYTCIMPLCGISGNVTIGSCSFIGGSAYIIPKKKIGNNTVVAAGSVVFTNVKDGTKVLGNPAKRIEI